MGDENKSLAMNREPRQCRQKSAVSSPSNSKDRRQFLRRGGKRSHRDDSSGSSRSSQGSKPVQQETDTVVLERRQKQIDYGKNTLAYDQYLKKVPKESRPFFMPRTPDKNVQYSRRQWDGLVKAWKLQIHQWNQNGSGKKISKKQDPPVVVPQDKSLDMLIQLVISSDLPYR